MIKQAFCRFLARSRQLAETLKHSLVLVIEYIDIHIAVARILQSVFHFKTVTGCHSQSRKQEVNIGRTVRTAELYRLLQCHIKVGRRLQRIDIADHLVGSCTPAERHTHKHRTVSVAPADVGRSFLMRNETEIGSRIGVAECCQRRSQAQISGNGFQCIVRQFASVFHHCILSVFHQAGMDMQTASGLAHCYLGSECHIHSILVSQRADNPFCHKQLVGCVFYIGGQELYFVLLVHQVIFCEVAHFRVAVFDQAACFCYVFHGSGTQFRSFVERSGLMITSLVIGKEEAFFRSHHIVFQLAHDVKVKSCHTLQLVVRLSQCVFRRHFERRTVFGVIAAKDVNGRNLAERIEESRPVSRHHIKVA